MLIDGHGHARIADFGLAALAGSNVADMSGTPSYMAPEQLTGEGASLRSDVFALGLVFHEMLTGKRVFEAKSLGELRALHAQTKPLSLSSATGVDPVFERIVLSCLARNPSDRPASGRVVLASLPGGDPLQAALLAGRTPSPEMVAASSKVGDLRPAVAAAAFGFVLLAMFVCVLTTGQTTSLGLLPAPKSPDLLAERARALLVSLGHGEPQARVF